MVDPEIERAVNSILANLASESLSHESVMNLQHLESQGRALFSERNGIRDMTKFFFRVWTSMVMMMTYSQIGFSDSPRNVLLGILWNLSISGVCADEIGRHSILVQRLLTLLACSDKLDHRYRAACIIWNAACESDVFNSAVVEMNGVRLLFSTCRSLWNEWFNNEEMYGARLNNTRGPIRHGEWTARWQFMHLDPESDDGEHTDGFDKPRENAIIALVGTLSILVSYEQVRSRLWQWIDKSMLVPLVDFATFCSVLIGINACATLACIALDRMFLFRHHNHISAQTHPVLRELGAFTALRNFVNKREPFQETQAVFWTLPSCASFMCCITSPNIDVRRFGMWCCQRFCNPSELLNVSDKDTASELNCNTAHIMPWIRHTYYDILQDIRDDNGHVPYDDHSVVQCDGTCQGQVPPSARNSDMHNGDDNSGIQEPVYMPECMECSRIYRSDISKRAADVLHNLDITPPPPGTSMVSITTDPVSLINKDHVRRTYFPSILEVNSSTPYCPPIDHLVPRATCLLEHSMEMDPSVCSPGCYLQRDVDGRRLVMSTRRFPSLRSLSAMVVIRITTNYRTLPYVAASVMASIHEDDTVAVGRTLETVEDALCRATHDNHDLCPAYWEHHVVFPPFAIGIDGVEHEDNSTIPLVTDDDDDDEDDELVHTIRQRVQRQEVVECLDERIQVIETLKRIITETSNSAGVCAGCNKYFTHMPCVCESDVDDCASECIIRHRDNGIDTAWFVCDDI